MSDKILSVGIDVGTSTTQLVFSELTIENVAGAFVVPRVEIVGKTVVHRSKIHMTPLISPELIDVEALRAIVEQEYRNGGFTPADIGTGAAIITGETARADNAASVLEALSNLAGEFVVATAGPQLESVLAARGAGIDTWSRELVNHQVIANLDIGGGTTNIAAYQHGKLLGTSCLDIGGRLVRITDGRISYISRATKRLAEANRITIEVGDRPDMERLRALTRVMARQLAMGIGLVPPDEMQPLMYTNDGVPLASSIAPKVISFSGGVADLIDAPELGDPFRYGDIGPLLGRAIAEDSAFSLVERFHGVETIGATVVGAGVHTTDISGSTISYAAGLLPMLNVPIIRIDDEETADPLALARTIDERLRLHHPDDPSRSVAIAMTGAGLDSFAAVQDLADAIIAGARSVLEGPEPLVVVLEHDRAKVLGQSLAVKRGRQDDLICIDGVHTALGDYIDIGLPVGDGRAVPVVVKTLVFNV